MPEFKPGDRVYKFPTLPEPCYHWELRGSDLIGYWCESCGEHMAAKPDFASRVRRARFWRAMRGVESGLHLGGSVSSVVTGSTSQSGTEG